MKKYYIIAPDADVNSLCNSMLEEDSFHSSITVVDFDKKKKQFAAWEVSREQLCRIFRAALDKGIPLKRFRVGVPRRSKSETIRFAQKEEYISGYQSQNKRPARLTEIQRDRRNSF